MIVPKSEVLSDKPLDGFGTLKYPVMVFHRF